MFQIFLCLKDVHILLQAMFNLHANHYFIPFRKSLVSEAQVKAPNMILLNEL